MDLNLDQFARWQPKLVADHAADGDADAVADDVYNGYADAAGDRNGLRWLVAHGQRDNSDAGCCHCSPNPPAMFVVVCKLNYNSEHIFLVAYMFCVFYRIQILMSSNCYSSDEPECQECTQPQQSAFIYFYIFKSPY